MRPEDSDPARLWDITRWGERLARLLAGVSWDEYQANEEKQIAVERCIEVIGEAARHLSDSFKHQHADIPWREIVQQRNVIAHGYYRLEHQRLWHVATVEVPKLIARLTPLLSEPPPNPTDTE
ncbi:MAG: DUF86 domain-containing protein [Alphaproteobacteria bacterium]|nr:DUF86 domain-containing protein [Alphaproteobacteria bacterium]